jgi:membrane-bound lytic murein transglycosylase A
VNELLWSNPRYVFFKEEPLDALDAGFGPRGAQGVPLTPGRSIAVDRQSIPYGTPVWLASSGPQVQLGRLVLAQDTGSAILGAVRADYFTGWGQEPGRSPGGSSRGCGCGRSGRADFYAKLASGAYFISASSYQNNSISRCFQALL